MPRADRQRYMAETTTAVIRQVFNNNVVLVSHNGRDEIWLGRGLGFGKKSGFTLNSAGVEHRFISHNLKAANRYAEMLADVPLEYITLAEEVVEIAVQKLGSKSSPALVLALVDHLQFAVKRVAAGIELEVPLKWEVKHLYPAEYQVAVIMVGIISSRLGISLPADEAVAIAMHLVSNEFVEPNLSQVYQQAALITEIFGLIEKNWKCSLNQDSLDASRFVTHIRYLMTRLQTKDNPRVNIGVARLVKTQIKEVLPLAEQIRKILEERVNRSVTEEERAYLAIHLEVLRQTIFGG